MRIGIFDSGLGGQYIAEQLKRKLAGAQIVLKTDSAHLPYGNKSPQQLLDFIKPILADFERQQVQVVVIACNTVTTNLLAELKRLTNLPLLGIEPELDQAVEQSKTKTIVVCATPGTLVSKRYQAAKQAHPQAKIIEPDCSRWAELIETGQFDLRQVEDLIILARSQQADTIVLGCTHYLYLTEALKHLDRGLTIITPTTGHLIKSLKELTSL